ncbi:MAG TPA: amino acid permease, partial [Thermoanaerobaculia bacterium]|nr:amino acid permease [Thermoanaerobaculia bacterium]
MAGSSSHRQAELGFWSATALVVGHTVGIGIFLTPAELIGARIAPALTIGLWLVGGALVVAGAWTFGELASRYPQAGGLYVYLQKAWGRRVAFLYGWQSLLIMDPGIIAALALGLAGYFALLFPAAAGLERWWALAAIWL